MSSFSYPAATIRGIALALLFALVARAEAQTQTPAAAPLSPNPSLSWQLPAQVKAGQQFTAVLRLNTFRPLRGLPVLVGYDPQLLQVVSVKEGEFFKQANGRTSFSERVDLTRGRIVAVVVRQSASGREASVNGAGAVIAVTFQALKPGSSAKIQLLSATPDPAPPAPVTMPVEGVVRVVR